jgi:hypothetical protein
MVQGQTSYLELWHAQYMRYTIREVWMVNS